MAKRVYDTTPRWRPRSASENGVLMPAGISTFGREIEWRAQRKATADGHRTGEILATNFSPSPGTDRQGPTAVLKSYCKMDFTEPAEHRHARAEGPAGVGEGRGRRERAGRADAQLREAWRLLPAHRRGGQRRCCSTPSGTRRSTRTCRCASPAGRPASPR